MFDHSRPALESPRPSRARLWAGPAVAVLGMLALLVPIALSPTSTAGQPAAQRVDIPGPLLWSRGFPDPTVVLSRVGYVAAATALDLNIGRAPADSGPWGLTPTPALTRRPDWATIGDIWAPDIQRAPGGWLMYFAAPISGYDENSRCIGVAVAKSAFGPFTPVGNAPLVCPVVPGVPRAGDTPPAKVGGVRVRGVIDPSSFIGNKGQRFLVYRTQGQPSSIRLVKLSQRGRRVQQGQASMLLTSSLGIEENPVIVRHDDKWVLFTSVGWFGHCAYRTTWRRSPDLKDWSRATPKVLLSVDNGLCGPGGADVLTTPDGRNQMFFHAWTCFRTPYPCPPDWNKDKPMKRHGLRAMYGANLAWTAAGRPRIESWIGSVLPPPTPTPSPTPTTASPTPTVTPTITPTVTVTVSPSVTLTP